MSEQFCSHSAEFEQKYGTETINETARLIERDSSILADIAIRFAGVERVPRYSAETRENDAEHSFMLTLVAQEIAASYFPNLNTGLVAQFCVVHDLVELLTDDVPTFALDDAGMEAKAAAEAAAIDTLCSELPEHTALLVRVYEEQDLLEARFVRLVDKLLPILVNIHGTGSQVMHEDYATFSHTQLDQGEQIMRIRFETMFPEVLFAPLRMARNGLARKFAEAFQPLVQLQDVLF